MDDTDSDADMCKKHNIIFEKVNRHGHYLCGENGHAFCCLFVPGQSGLTGIFGMMLVLCIILSHGYVNIKTDCLETVGEAALPNNESSRKSDTEISVIRKSMEYETFSGQYAVLKNINQRRAERLPLQVLLMAEGERRPYCVFYARLYLLTARTSSGAILSYIHDKDGKKRQSSLNTGIFLLQCRITA
ncbi:MAG: hypothetical protein J6D08_03675 [Lachnospiraceae bacterium]|nr:hypothetical protein [Lachnospiraceae bacterium]